MRKTIEARAESATPAARRGAAGSRKDSIRILLLEGIHPAAEDNFQKNGLKDIATDAASFSEEQLLGMIRDVHVVGIRSKTRITRRIMEASPQLLAVGCFCI